MDEYPRLPNKLTYIVCNRSVWTFRSFIFKFTLLGTSTVGYTDKDNYIIDSSEFIRHNYVWMIWIISSYDGLMSTSHILQLPILKPRWNKSALAKCLGLGMLSPYRLNLMIIRYGYDMWYTKCKWIRGSVQSHG